MIEVLTLTDHPRCDSCFAPATRRIWAHPFPEPPDNPDQGDLNPYIDLCASCARELEVML